jgi:hypothetical protein
MARRTKLAAGTATAIVLAIGASVFGVAAANSGEGPDTPIEGAALERASAAALEATGGGTVTETEVGDEESLYEVEVLLPDGSSVDVQLDEAFQVVGSSPDVERPDDRD